MDPPESALLVPDTPTGTAQTHHPAHEEQSFDETNASSYLFAALGKRPAAPASSPGPHLPHPSADFYSQGPHGGRNDSLADDSRMPVEGEVTTIHDSQVPSRRSPEPSSPPASPKRTRRSLDPSFSASRLDVGPGLGDLGETQVQSLDERSWEREQGRSRWSSAGEPLKELRKEKPVGGGEEKDEAVSMELTRVEGGVLEQTGDTEQHDAAADVLVHPTPSSESQKENPPPSLPAPNGSFGKPFLPRNSHSNLDDSTAPSSSPAVAQNLLQRSPAKRPDPSQPASSADPDIPMSQLLPPARGPRAASVLEGEELPNLPRPTASGEVSSGPITSTPAYAHPPPPQPLTAVRTLPAMTFPVAAPLAPPPMIRSRSAANSSVFATSDAMKAPPPPKPKPKRSDFDSLSTDESVKSTQPTQDQTQAQPEEESPFVEQTMVHVEDEDQLGEPEKRAEPPKPTMERTMDMDIDDGDSVDRTLGAGDFGTGSLGSSLVSSMAAPAPVQPAQSTFDASLDMSYAHPSGSPLFAAPSATSSPSGSQGPSSRTSQKAGGRNKRLSDISKFGSSPNPTQYEVMASQQSYDVLASGGQSEDAEISNENHWHASFAYDTVTSNNNSHSRQTTSTTTGRELSRKPPPPTPVRDGIDRHAVIKAPSSPTRSGAVGGSSMDPTQLVDDGDESLPHPDLALGRGAPSSAARLPAPAAKLKALGPTQSVPESSPEVALALKRRPSRSSRSPSRPPPQAPSTQHGRLALSGDVVPDSEGPTQPAAPAPEPIASSSRAQVPPQDFYEEEFGGGFDDEGDAQMQDVQEDEEREVEAPAKKGKKGKGKEPAKVRVPPTVKKVVAGSKSKGRALQAEDSPDALDLLSTTTNTSRRKGGSAGTTVEETNYSDLPSVRNAKKSSPKKAAPASKGKAKRRASAVPSEDEEEEQVDELAETASEEERVEKRSPAKKKRRTSRKAVVEEEDEEEEEEEPPRKARRTSAGKATSKGKKVKVEKKPTARRHSKTASVSSAASASTAAGSPEPQQPVAGPSRLRFQSVDDDEGSRQTSPAGTVRSSSSIKTGGSKPAGVLPFSRVFALWRDDGSFYPATIVSNTRSHFKVRFDDKSEGRLKPDELRRCELVQGDVIVYYGNEVAAETQTGSLYAELVVQRVDRADASVEPEESEEGLSRDDEILASSTNHDEGRLHRIRVSAAVIPALHAAQLDNRKLTADELGLINPAEKPVALKLDKPPRPTHVSPLEINTTTPALFARTAFLVTFRSGKGGLSVSQKQSLVDRIEEHGGTVIDWEHLFTVDASASSKAGPRLVFNKDDFRSIDSIFLLADATCSTVKYLISLGLGVPCLSKEFALQSIAQKRRLDWAPFLLASGFVQDLNAYSVGGQVAALRKSAFGLASLKEWHDEGKGVFAGKSFLVVKVGAGAEKKDRKASKEEKKRAEEERGASERQSYTFLALLSSAGAARVDFVSSPSAAGSATGYDHVFLDETGASSNSKGDAPASLPAALARHRGVGNVTWAKQCLMAGRWMPAARMKEAEEH
ncbi:hypothetical protein JCM10207_001775 [Rhodosporidiobolus poonsookiae]